MKLTLLSLMLLMAAGCDPVPYRANLGEPCDPATRCRAGLVCERQCRLPSDAGADDAAGLDADVTMPADASLDEATPDSGDPSMLPPSPPDQSTPQIIGCADRTREGFVDVRQYPNIASCAGAWTLPGLGEPEPACGRTSGNDGRPGFGCAAEDLCAPGWHVCLSVREMTTSGFVTCADAAVDAFTFFATAQPGRDRGAAGTDCPAEDRTGKNNVFGCGLIGAPATNSSCSSLRMLAMRPGSPPDCNSFAPWDCGLDHEEERLNVTKPGVEKGGVICCRDGRPH